MSTDGERRWALCTLVAADSYASAESVHKWSVCGGRGRARNRHQLRSLSRLTSRCQNATTQTKRHARPADNAFWRLLRTSICIRRRDAESRQRFRALLAKITALFLHRATITGSLWSSLRESSFTSNEHRTLLIGSAFFDLFRFVRGRDGAQPRLRQAPLHSGHQRQAETPPLPLFSQPLHQPNQPFLFSKIPPLASLIHANSHQLLFSLHSAHYHLSIFISL